MPNKSILTVLLKAQINSDFVNFRELLISVSSCEQHGDVKTLAPIIIIVVMKFTLNSASANNIEFFDRLHINTEVKRYNGNPIHFLF